MEGDREEGGSQAVSEKKNAAHLSVFSTETQFPGAERPRWSGKLVYHFEKYLSGNLYAQGSVCLLHQPRESLATT